VHTLSTYDGCKTILKDYQKHHQGQDKVKKEKEDVKDIIEKIRKLKELYGDNEDS
jgi:hypothetical protein